MLGLIAWLLFAQSGPAQARPLGQHCYDVGPLPELPPDWCGCTWGAIYVDGAPVAGARITLTFGTGVVSGTTALSALEPYPYYAMHAYDLGARYGSLVTVTASYAGASLTRTIRLVPDEVTKEQALNFAFLASGHWEPWADLPSVRALATQDGQLWAGMPNGPMRWDLTTGISRTFSTGLASENVQALVIGPDGDVWVGTPAGLSRYDSARWTAQNTGLASPNIRALAVGPDGSVWAGASHVTAGGVSRYDSATAGLRGQTWQPLPDFNGGLPNLVTALAVDATGRAWVGTDGYGVSRWDGAAWRMFTAEDGLASDIVYAIAAEPGAVWFGTWSYLTGEGAFGGVGRYDLASGAWTAYRHGDGLALDDVVAVAVDARGRPWFGTWGGGISRFDGRNWRTYTAADGLGSDYVRAVAVGADGTVWAGTEDGLARFVPGAPGRPPVIQQVIISPTVAAPGDLLFFQAVVADGNGDDGSVVAYDWRSDLDGPLGSEAAFTLASRLLTPGLHTISVRGQDDEGMWSEAVTRTLKVQALPKIALPLVIWNR
jgi:hypothetical protein